MIFSACSKPGANVNLEDQLTVGTWTVSYYAADSVDQTALFFTYTFLFENDGDLVANDQGILSTGSWVRTNTSNENPRMMINFGSNAPLNRFNEDWVASNRKQNQVTFTENASDRKSVV